MWPILWSGVAFSTTIQTQETLQPAPLRVDVEVRQSGIGADTGARAGALATYRLSAQVQQFTFHEILTATDETGVPVRDLLRDGIWELTSPDFYLKAGTVQRYDGLAFDAFDVLIRPDTAEYGRVYPALVPLGDGIVIGLEYLAGARAQMETVIRLLAGDGQIVLAGGQPAALDLEVVLAQGGKWSNRSKQ